MWLSGAGGGIRVKVAEKEVLEIGIRIGELLEVVVEVGGKRCTKSGIVRMVFLIGADHICDGNGG